MREYMPMKTPILTDVLCFSRARVTVYPLAKRINRSRKTRTLKASNAFPVRLLWLFIWLP